jgi:hypothetical protein
MSIYEQSTSFKARNARELMEVGQESFRKLLQRVRNLCDERIKEACSRGFGSIEFSIPTKNWIGGTSENDKMKLGRELAYQLYDDGYSVRGNCDRLKIIWHEESTPRGILTNSNSTSFGDNNRKKKTVRIMT